VIEISSDQPLRARLLIPSIALIVAATMIPYGLRHPSLHYIDYSYSLADFLNNLILYLPLGFSLYACSLRRAFLVGLALSTSAEVLQLTYVDRIPSPFDILKNTAGAVMGYLLAAFWIHTFKLRPNMVPIARPVAALGVPVAVVGVLLLVRTPVRSDFSNWDSSFDLVIGNEATGNHPWVGTLSELAIYPAATDARQIRWLSYRDGNSATLNSAANSPALGTPLYKIIPPAAIRTGDFTSVKSARNGTAISIKDPFTGSPFPGEHHSAVAA
jgi:VanZ family protein